MSSKPTAPTKPIRTTRTSATTATNTQASPSAGPVSSTTHNTITAPSSSSSSSSIGNLPTASAPKADSHSFFTTSDPSSSSSSRKRTRRQSSQSQPSKPSTAASSSSLSSAHSGPFTSAPPPRLSSADSRRRRDEGLHIQPPTHGPSSASSSRTAAHLQTQSSKASSPSAPAVQTASSASPFKPNRRPSEQSQCSKRQRKDSSGSYNLRPRISSESSSSSIAAASISTRSSKRPKQTSDMSPSQAASSSAKAARSRARWSKTAGGASGQCDLASDAELSVTYASEAGTAMRRTSDDDQISADIVGDETHGDIAAEAEDDDDPDDGEELVNGIDNYDWDSHGRALNELDDDDDDDGGPYDDEMDDAWGDDGGGGFGSNLRIMAEFLSGAQSRFRTLLASLRSRKDPTAQLVALQELSEVLSLSNEDTLAGYFPTESFTRELLYIMGGPKPPVAAVGGEAGDACDEDAVTIEAIAASGLVDRGEMTLLACRCLANLIEAMPYAAHSVVAYGAVPLLLSKLTEIEFIDLAEQTLQTLEKISVDYPSSIVREGGLMAMLQYLDFFNIHIQRGAMMAASHCCRKLSTEHFSKALEVIPIIRNVLAYSDQRLVESACKCIVRMIESFKHQPDLLEQLLDKELAQALNALLLQGSPTSAGIPTTGTAIGTSTYTDVLKSLGSAVRTSPKIAVLVLEINVVETLYHLLTGSVPPNEDGQGGRGPAASGSSAVVAPAAQSEARPATTSETTAVAIIGGESEGVAVADMAILQNLAQRPKEQIQEALSLVSDLLPPLPRDGIFDPRNYTEKAWHKRRKQRTSRETTRGRAFDSSTTSPTAKAKVENEDSDIQKMAGSGTDDGSGPTTSAKYEKPKTEKEMIKERAQSRRIDMLRERQSIVKRFTQLVLPTLVEVYAASVALHVRTKALTAMLKIMSFVEAEPLCEVLDNVPLASFVASILSTRDDPSLVVSALCMVEILCEKLPNVYQSLLRREGVMWEVEDIASKEPSAVRSMAKTSQSKLTLPGSGSSITNNGVASAGGMGDGRSSEPADAAATVTAGGAAPTEALAALLASPNGLALRRAHPVSLPKPAIAGPSAADAQDATIWRARILRDHFARQAAKADGGADHAVRALDNVKSLVTSLDEAAVKGPEAAEATLHAVANLFCKPEEPISSFELLRSGLVDGLYSFAAGNSEQLPRAARRELFLKALMTPDRAGNSRASAMVRRLQESLSRLENLDIVMTLDSGTEDSLSSSRRIGHSGVHRQLRLRLQTDDEDVPKSCNNLIVGIHAIASFDRLADFLRPKISIAMSAGGSGGLAGPGGLAGSRLSSVLAALNASSAGLEGAAVAARAALPNPLASTTGAAAAAAAAAATPATGAATEGSTAGSSTTQDADVSASASTEKPRRRSSRLSGIAASSSRENQIEQAAGEEQTPSSSADQETGEGVTAGKGKEAVGDGAEASDMAARRLLESLLPDGIEDRPYSDEEMGDGIFEDEIGADGEIEITPPEAEDKAISLSVVADGDKLEVKTSEGTRVPTELEAGTSSSGSSSLRSAATSSGSATPMSIAAAPAASFPASSPARPSYSAALQRKPSDWHLEFSMNGRNLAPDSTIYAAVHETSTATTPSVSSSVSNVVGPGAAVGGGAVHRYIWTDVYTVKFKKVSGPMPSSILKQTPEPESTSMAEAELPASIPRGSAFAKVLQLLRILHDLNSEWRETRSESSLDFSQTAALSENAFVNNKLTAKLNRQLEEAMIVASKCLPDWSLQLPRRFFFLFPFEARYAFLQSTAFGYNRMLQRWQSRASRAQDNVGGNNSNLSRLDDSLAHLVRLPRAKVRIARENILPSAFRVMELYGKTDTILEVEYFDEVGTGLGPTLEFYALTSKEFARKDLRMWRDQSAADSSSRYIYAPLGLFPAPISVQEQATAGGKGRLAAFKTLGQFVAKAVLDSRIIDCHFSAVFMRTVLNQRVPLTLGMLKVVDAVLAKSLERMLEMNEEEVAALALDFTLPGDPTFELEAGGKEKDVTKSNVEAYVAAIVDVSLSRGLQPLVRAFRAGFNAIFPVAAMTSFTAEELVMLFGNTEEDWSEATLQSAIKPDHGYSSESSTFHDLLSIMSAFTLSERREFLQWLTGSPKLPIGGFAGLQPQLTVVKRPHEEPLRPDDYLASNMSCANFLKLPEYSTRQVMKDRLHKAVTEGAGAFNLS